MTIIKTINWFIPLHIQSDEQLYIRARSNVAVAIALGIAAIIYSILFTIMHHPAGAWAIIILVATLVLPAPLVMRFSGSIKLSGNMVTLAMFMIQVFLSVTSGGISSQNISWFATVPVLGTLLVGFGYGIFWGLLSASSILAFYIMEKSGFVFPSLPVSPAEDLTFRFIIFTGLVLIILGFTLLYEGLKNTALRSSKLTYDQLKETFEKITENTELLARSSDELANAGEIIEENADNALKEVTQMVYGTDGVNQNIHNLASSIKEISVNVEEISNNTGQAAGVSQEAVNLVDSVNSMISKLDVNNKEIGEMTGVISDIAFQTNLLALNAAIEAARAGETGRGFAVVAGAVRTLSLESTEAANKISDKIRIVQDDTNNSIQLIKQVNELIYKFNDLMNYIAGAVKEQTDTIATMSQNAGDAADETSRIAQRSQSVSQSSESTSRGINDILAATKEMKLVAVQLRTLTQSHD